MKIDWVSVLAGVFYGIIIGAAIAALAVPKNACAEETTWLVATVHSYHYDQQKDHEEQNWGLGVEHQFNSDWSASTGIYRNSYGRRSVLDTASSIAVAIDTC